MKLDRLGTLWMRIAFPKALDRFARTLAALEAELHSERQTTRALSETVGELRANVDRDGVELATLRTAVARLEKQLQWVSDEAQKTGIALLERVERSRRGQPEP